ncbi:MAG: L,D-transpeptidase family protein [Rhizobiaceae bacterium]
MRRGKIIGLVALVAIATFTVSNTTKAAEKNPLQIIVSLEEQNLKVFRGKKLVTQSNISSGKRGHETPTGVFSVLQKNRHHRSNIYSGAPMPFMQRLTWSGIALHSSNSVPDYPASHGCVRLPHAFARQLFNLDTRGAHVIIEQTPQEPQEIGNDFLPQPERVWQVSTSNDIWVNDFVRKSNLGILLPNPELKTRILFTRRTQKEDLLDTQRILNKLGFNSGEVDGIMGPVTWAAIVRFQKTNGIDADGKVNKALLQKLYNLSGEEEPPNGRVLVRQHHRTIYEAAASISNPELPLGSHLLITSNFDKDSMSTDWLYVSLNDRVHRDIGLQTGAEIDPTSDRRSIHDALARVVMEKPVRRQISRLLTPGSSIAISDNGLSIETGAKGTDFIVLTKPEPQNTELAAKL